MLSVPHYLGSTLRWPTFIILSLEGFYLQQRRLAVIVFCTIQYWVCACEFLSKKKTVCVLLFVTRRLLAALIHKAFGTCFRHLFLGPSPLWLSTFSKETWQQSRCECVCMCGCVWSLFAYLPLCRYQSVGASWGDCRRHYLGDVHDHQPGQQVRDPHWGGAVCFLGCSLLIFQPITQHLPALFLPPRLLLTLPDTRHKHAHR